MRFGEHISRCKRLFEDHYVDRSGLGANQLQEDVGHKPNAAERHACALTWFRASKFLEEAHEADSNAAFHARLAERKRQREEQEQHRRELEEAYARGWEAGRASAGRESGPTLQVVEGGRR